MNKLIVFVALGLISIFPVTAFAGAGGNNQSQGKNQSGSSIALVQPGGASAAPTYGSQVTFAVSTTETTSPWVYASCVQNGSVVYEQWAGFWPGYPGGQTFTLGPTMSWSGGAADCTAQLVVWTQKGTAKTLASTSFHVSG